MRRIPIAPLAVVVSLSASACLTEEPKCPEGLERKGSLCVEVDHVDSDAGAKADAGNDASQHNPHDASQHNPHDASQHAHDAGHTNDGGPSTDAEIPNDAGDDSGKDGGDGSTPSVCYLDFDHDGAGAGDAVNCDDPLANLSDASTLDGGDADTDAGASPAVVGRDDDCDDHDPNRAPTLHELCDGIDNDCNDKVDDGATNACGGSCATPLAHTLGDSCTNGQGACKRSGKYACQSDHTAACNAPVVSGSDETCGDEVDNDCDGETDEADAVDAPIWYKDCDGDGYASTGATPVRACTKPQPAQYCSSWSNIQPTDKQSTDCKDYSSLYAPNASYTVPTSNNSDLDFNCDGNVTSDPNGVPDVNHPVCSQQVLDVLNGPTASCPLVGTCYVWYDGSLYGGGGLTYRRTPPKLCPDDALAVTAGSSDCSTTHYGPILRCR